MTRLIFKFIIILFLSLTFSVCSGDESVVKNGTLDFDKSITVGQAFDKYKYFSSTKWKCFSTDNGKKIVEVKGDFKNEYLKLLQKFEVEYDENYWFEDLI